MIDLIGRTVGPYHVLERLEDRRTFTTFRAVDPRLFGQPVALTIFPVPADDREFVHRFESAAEALMALRHPNILPLYDFGETAGLVYLATPYLEAPTLGNLLGVVRQPAEALGLIATLCETLDHAHHQGLVHGGLTPDAIRLTNLPPGQDALQASWPILHEYGFVPLLGAGEPGSPDLAAYQPPEETSNEGTRADIYALAAILRALLAGKPAAASEGEAAPTLPEALDTTLQRALAAEPRARFGSGAEFLAALREAMSADRRDDDETATALLEEARAAVTAGRFLVASEAYEGYLRLKPQDELALREFTAIEQQRVEAAKRRAALAATALAATPAGAKQAHPATPAPPGAAAIPPALFAWDQRLVDQPAAVGSAAAPGVPASEAPVSVPAATPPGQPYLPRGSLTGTALLQPRKASPQTFKPVVAPARQRHQVVLPLAITALVLVVFLTLAGLALARRGHIGSGTPGVNATGIQPGGVIGAGSSPAAGLAGGTPVPGALVVPSIPVAPTVPPTTPTPTPTVPPLPPVFTDGFDNPASGFPTASGNQNGAGYQNGEYVITVPDPDSYEIADFKNPQFPNPFGDLVVEVDIHAVGAPSGGSYGLVFHRIDTGSSIDEYFVLIDPTAGAVRLVRWSGDQHTDVIPATTSPAIKKGNEVNHLIVTVKGDKITIQINGQDIASKNDPGPSAGMLSLRADAGAGPIEAHFDNLIIRPAR
jgi:hypothetical protein